MRVTLICLGSGMCWCTSVLWSSNMRALRARVRHRQLARPATDWRRALGEVKQPSAGSLHPDRGRNRQTSKTTNQSHHLFRRRCCHSFSSPPHQCAPIDCIPSPPLFSAMWPGKWCRVPGALLVRACPALCPCMSGLVVQTGRRPPLVKGLRAVGRCLAISPHSLSGTSGRLQLMQGVMCPFAIPIPSTELQTALNILRNLRPSSGKFWFCVNTTLPQEGDAGWRQTPKPREAPRVAAQLHRALVMQATLGSHRRFHCHIAAFRHVAGFCKSGKAMQFYLHLCTTPVGTAMPGLRQHRTRFVLPASALPPAHNMDRVSQGSQ